MAYEDQITVQDNEATPDFVEIHLSLTLDTARELQRSLAWTRALDGPLKVLYSVLTDYLAAAWGE